MTSELSEAAWRRLIAQYYIVDGTVLHEVGLLNNMAVCRHYSYCRTANTV